MGRQRRRTTRNSERYTSESLKQELLENEEDLIRTLRQHSRRISEKYLISSQKALEALSKATQEETIPLSIFSPSLSPLEAVVHHLKRKGYRFSRIARLLGRDPRIIWKTYSNATSKGGITITTKDCMHIPADILADRKLSITESICSFLKQKGLKNHEIASALRRSDQAVYIALKRAGRKKDES